MKKLFRYSALVLGLVLSTFFILMALENFPTSFDPGEILRFIIRLMPGLVLGFASAISFRMPWPGVIIFTILTVLLTFFYHTYSNIQLFITLSLPMVIITILLYSASGGKRKKSG